MAEVNTKEEQIPRGIAGKYLRTNIKEFGERLERIGKKIQTDSHMRVRTNLYQEHFLVLLSKITTGAERFKKEILEATDWPTDD